MNLLEVNADSSLFNRYCANEFGHSYGPGPTTVSNTAYWTGPGPSQDGLGFGPCLGTCFESPTSYGRDAIELAENSRFEQQLHYDWNRAGIPRRHNFRGSPEPTVGPGFTQTQTNYSISSPESFHDNVNGFESPRHTQSHLTVSRPILVNSNLMTDNSQFLNRRHSLQRELSDFTENITEPTYDLYGISIGISFSLQ